jgi:uncharacterized protein (TIGR04255 family)
VEVGLTEWLNLAAQPRKVYTHPPLTLALCQVRFATKLSVNNGASVAPFQDAIQDEYPDPAPPTQQVAEIQIASPGGRLEHPGGPQSVLWQFSDISGEWSVVLTQDFLTLETRSYDHFDDFLRRLERILKVLTDTIRPSVGRRIGLRYINEIRPGHRNWSRVIQPELLGPLAIDLFSQNCIQSVQVMNLKAGEARINLQHGAFSTGTTVKPKPGLEVPEEPFYLLDFDVYEEFTAPRTLPMDPSVICKHVATYHQAISKLFLWSVTEEYTATLEERYDDC